MSDLQGTTMGEVALVTLVLPASYLLHSLAVFWCAPRFGGPTVPSTLLRFGVDFVCLVLPTIIAFLLPQFLLHLFAGMLLLCAALEACCQWWCGASCFVSIFGPDLPSKNAAQPLVGKRKHFLSVYRSSMMISTCIAILAVDFPAFPRRFAKTETFGTSLMDLGVGSFLLSNALVSAHSDRKSVLNLITRASPLIVLGFIRLLTVKGTNYQEHVTEYGVHWNFFFTLAAVTLLANLFGISKNGAFQGLFLALCYQGALSLGGLSDFIIRAPRIDLLSQNREGLFSSIGYFALFLVGADLGRVLLADRPTRGEGWRLVITLAVCDAALWAATLIVDSSVEPISRRMVNLAYVLSILAQNIFTLWLLVSLSLLVRPASRPWDGLMQAINRNQLFIFLVANLLVGLVNFSIQTIYASNWAAIGVVTSYMMVLCGFAATLHAFNINIKFW